MLLWSDPVDMSPMSSAFSLSPVAYAIVETAIGPIGIGWSAAGIRSVALPQRDRVAMERRFTAKLEGATPGDAAISRRGDRADPALRRR